MNVQFNKNVFYGNEVCAANVAVDNHACKAKINSVSFELQQRLNIYGHHREHYSNFTVIRNDDRSVIMPGQTEVTTKQMQLNLASIAYIVNNMKRKKRPGIFSGHEMVPRSPEEIFMLSQLSPACHSRHIKNEYYLNVHVNYDGCMCCASRPSISVPLTVIPMTNPATYGFTEPQGYAPQELFYMKFAPLYTF
jgi:hypothetical protein